MSSSLRSSQAKPALAPSRGFLEINGRAFSFGAATDVMLHGINFSNEPADSCSNSGIADIRRINYDRDDYARVSSWGGNVVRFNMDYRWYVADRAQFFNVLDRHVQWAKANHLWLIPSLGTAPGGGCDFQQTGLWRNQANQDRLNSFWEDFAGHYAQEPNIAGYDMLNEPGAPSEGDWQRLGRRLRDTITAVDHNHFVVYEATKTGSSPLAGDNVVYSDHDYPGSDAYPNSAPRAPLFIGEFGSVPPTIARSLGSRQSLCGTSEMGFTGPTSRCARAPTGTDSIRAGVQAIFSAHGER